MPSTIEELKDKTLSSAPKETLHIVNRKVGGVTHATSGGSLPRNRQQVHDLRRRRAVYPLHHESNSSDQFLAVLLMCKDTHKDFVRSVTGAPEYTVVLAYDQTLNDIARFCTNENGFEILTVDPTFDLGDFNVTVTCFKHPLLLTRKDGKHPTMFGPLFIHQRKQFATYNNFASTLISLNPMLSSLRCFGTDGEDALDCAFTTQFKKALHLRCWLHFKDNVKHKLQKLRIPNNIALEFIADIFGSASQLQKGLADAEDEGMFDTLLASLKESWNERETAVTGEKPCF